MSDHHTYDVIGIGLGPFNLGLACLAEPIEELDALFLEAREQFDWHPGMLLPEATLQVPFLADLVSLADPTSPYSFLAFLKERGRIYSFYIRESFYPLRREYNQYCQWAAERLGSVRFGQDVVRIDHDGESYVVATRSGERYRSRRLVLGTGTSPHVPESLVPALDGGTAIHSSEYLGTKSKLQECRHVAVVGSGQSAAEVYADLLDEIDDHGYELTWVTRSPRFFPLEYTKLTLEMTSPEYTRYFQGLTAGTRRRLLEDHKHLYKGISSDTINAIFDRLYARMVNDGTGPQTTLLTSSEVMDSQPRGDEYVLDLHHVEQDRPYRLEVDGLVSATGYRPRVPEFVEPIRDRIHWDDTGRFQAGSTYAIDPDGTEIFVQNAEEHTHGFVAPDLGMGAFRNSVILAAILGHEPYPVEKRIAFQEFGAPDRLRTR